MLDFGIHLSSVFHIIAFKDDTNMAVKESSEMASSLNQEPRKGMILPFQPLSLAFNHISYYVDMSAFAYAFLTLACYDYKNFLLADVLSVPRCLVL